MEATPWLWCVGFSPWWLLLLEGTGSKCAGFRSCSSRAQEHPGWLLWHMGSSQIRDQTHVSCFGRWILCYWATREAPRDLFRPLRKWVAVWSLKSSREREFPQSLASPCVLLWVIFKHPEAGAAVASALFLSTTDGCGVGWINPRHFTQVSLLISAAGAVKWSSVSSLWGKICALRQMNNWVRNVFQGCFLLRQQPLQRAQS